MDENKAENEREDERHEPVQELSDDTLDQISGGSSGAAALSNPQSAL